MSLGHTFSTDETHQYDPYLTLVSNLTQVMILGYKRLACIQLLYAIGHKAIKLAWNSNQLQFVIQREVNQLLNSSIQDMILH